MSDLTLEKIYQEILLRKPFEVEGLTQASYNNLRTALLRKFRATNEMFVNMGAPSPYAEEYLQCKYKQETMTATFSLASKAERKTQPNRWKVRSF